MKKILFVCLGNICRSPAAEGVFIHYLKSQNLEKSYEVDSAGTSGFHEGHWPDERMIAEAKKRGITLPSRSRPLTKKDFTDFDHIICMDKSNLKNAQKINGGESSKLSLMTDYFKASDYQKSFDEIPDPYYGTLKDFNLVLDLVTDASVGLLEKLQNERE